MLPEPSHIEHYFHSNIEYMVCSHDWPQIWYLQTHLWCVTISVYLLEYLSGDKLLIHQELLHHAVPKHQPIVLTSKMQSIMLEIIQTHPPLNSFSINSNVHMFSLWYFHIIFLLSDLPPQVLYSYPNCSIPHYYLVKKLNLQEMVHHSIVGTLWT